MRGTPDEIKLAQARGRLSRRRRTKRDQFWPDANEVVFPTRSGGWSQVPRTVPLVAALIDALDSKMQAGRLYMTLWSYEFGDGYVEVPDPALVGLEAGYSPSRAARTFEERMNVLRGLGFIRAQRLGAREFGYVLLVDPHRVVVEIRSERRRPVSELWWSAFVSRCGLAGIPLPEMPGEPK